MRPMKSCLHHRHRRAREGPSTLGSTGTSRQPMTFWLWWRTASSRTRISRRARRGVAREEALGDAVVARVRQLDAGAPEHALVVRVGDVEEDARAVARAGIAPGRAAMGEPAQDLEPLDDDVVCGGRRRSATKPSPQASCSSDGSYRPRSGGNGIVTSSIRMLTRRASWNGRLDSPNRINKYSICLSKCPRRPAQLAVHA